MVELDCDRTFDFVSWYEKITVKINDSLFQNVRVFFINLLVKTKSVLLVYILILIFSMQDQTAIFTRLSKVFISKCCRTRLAQIYLLP